VTGKPFSRSAIRRLGDFLNSSPWFSLDSAAMHRLSWELPGLCGFDFLGIPWILSSESRLFSGLAASSSRKYFHRAFALSQNL
jgi:hypothetical protein